MKEGEAHLDDGCRFSTPIIIRQSISLMRVALCIFGIGYGLPSCTLWFLGVARIKLKRPGNARFELQIVDVPHEQEDVIDGDGPFFEVQHCAFIMQGLFANAND